MASEQNVLRLFEKVDFRTLQTKFVDTLCCVLLVLGIIGNVLNLFIFSSSRRSWRTSPDYVCLALCTSIINLLCLIRYTSILHSTSRHLLQELIREKWWACKLYETSSSFRVISSWITLWWMFERLIFISTMLRTLFNRWMSFRWNFMIPITINGIIISCVIGPSVYMFQPQMANRQLVAMAVNVTKTYCGLDSTVSVKWQTYFYQVGFGRNHNTIRCLFSELIPAVAIIAFIIYISFHLVQVYRQLHHSYGQIPRQKRSRATSWRSTVLIVHSFLLLSSLLSHVAGHFMNSRDHETCWLSLAIIVNCSLNCYIYCLSCKAFRNEIRLFLRRYTIQLYRTFPNQQQPDCQSNNV